MLKKILKILIYFLVIIFFAFFEVSFLKTLGAPFSYFQIVLTASIFTAIVFSLNHSFFWIILGGYLLDLYSPSLFGLTLLSMFAAVLITKGLSQWRFTSHTIHSLILLSILGTLIYHVSFFFLNKLLMFFGKSTIYFSLNFIEILWYTTANVCLLILIFIVIKNFSKRFKILYL